MVVDEGRESRQAADGQRDRIAIRVGRLDGNVEDIIALDGRIRDGGQHGCTVGVDDGDRHTTGGGQRDAGAVAIVRGGERDEILAGLGVAGRPIEHGRVGVERGARRQTADRVGHRGGAAFERCQGPVGQAVGGHEAGIIGVGGEGAETDFLAFRHCQSL